VITLLVALGVPLEALVAPLLDAKDQQGAQAALLALRANRWLVFAAAVAILGGAAGTIKSAPGAHWLRASIAFTVALLALYAGVIAPVERGIAQSRTFKPFLAEVRERIGGADLGFFCAFDYGAVFYAERHVPLLLDEDECKDPARRAAALAAPRTPYLLLWEDDAERAAAQLQVLLRSTGTGTQGRARMVLAAPVGAVPPSGAPAGG
jgi:hypothetical protein